MVQSSSIIFDPSPETTSAILIALTDPDISFNQLARACGTSPDAFALWLSRPDIRQTIESVDRATTWRTRLVASSHLHVVSPALVKILQDFTELREAQSARRSDHPGHVAPAPSDPAPPQSEFRDRLLAIRHAEAVRKSAALLIGLARVRPTAGPELAAPAPTQPESRPAHAPIAPPAPSPTPAHTDRPVPSLDDLLCQLAPHLQTMAAELGIDPNHPEAEPTTPSVPRERQAGADEHAEREVRNASPVAPIAAPSGRGEAPPAHRRQDRPTASLVTAGAHEHWP